MRLRCRGSCMIHGISPYRCGFNLKVDNASAPTGSIVGSIADLLDRLRPEIEAQLKPNLQGIFGGVIRGYLPQAWAFKTDAETVTISVDSHGNVSLRSGGSLNPDVLVKGSLDALSDALSTRNPIAVLFLIWLYGAGVLVMRETAVRWKTGWPSILLLGAAYGIIEEGLAVKSFFDPAWMDLGTLGWYGRWLDVNWVWAVWLTIYHAVVSIAIPIFLMEWIWPRVRGQPLTSRRGYITAIALLAGATIFIDILLTPYRPSVWHLLGASAAVVFLVWAAKRYAGVLWSRLPSRKAPASPRTYAVAGFGFLMGSFLLYSGGPFFGVVPIITVFEW